MPGLSTAGWDVWAGSVGGRAGGASSHASAYKNSVTEFLAGILGGVSASKADLSTQTLAAAGEVWGGRNGKSHLW